MAVRNRMFLIKYLGMAVCLYLANPCSGDTLSEDFTDLSGYSSGDAIWNQGTGTLHTPFVNFNYSGGAEELSINLGDGSHGAFNQNTLENFGTLVGSDLTINTDSYPNGLLVTEFNLPQSVNIIGTGTNPLVIRSLSDVVIAGTINCSGSSGGDVAAPTATPSGGAGRCGGAMGGNGGSNTGTNPTIGSSSGNLFAVSGGGIPSSGSGGGGGGGAYNGSSNATSGSGSGGTGGSSQADDEFTETSGGFGGGSGGGGGGASGASSGGGGGAGGGVVMIYSGRDFRIESTGSVRANGGDGGAGAGNGGGGGGGGGGSILVFAGRNILGSPFAANQLSAKKGNGGVTAGSKGGDGADGRTWVSDRLGILNDGEEPVSVLVPGGNVSKSLGTFSVISKEKDLVYADSTLTNFSWVTVGTLCGTCDVTLQVASSEESGFDPALLWKSAEAGMPLKRFVRYRLNLVSGDRANGPEIDDLSITYQGVQLTDFSFVTGCGSIKYKDKGKGATHPIFFLLFLLTPVFLLLFLKTMSRYPLNSDWLSRS